MTWGQKTEGLAFQIRGNHKTPNLQAAAREAALGLEFPSSGFPG